MVNSSARSSTLHGRTTLSFRCLSPCEDALHDSPCLSEKPLLDAVCFLGMRIPGELVTAGVLRIRVAWRSLSSQRVRGCRPSRLYRWHTPCFSFPGTSSTQVPPSRVFCLG